MSCRTRIRGYRWYDEPRRLVEIVDPVSLLVGRGIPDEFDWGADEVILLYHVNPLPAFFIEAVRRQP